MSRRFWPCHAGGHDGDRPLADRQRVVGDHRALGHLVDAAEAVAARARALCRVRREVLGVEHRLARRIRAGARIEHADEARDRRHAADRRARSGRAALLLQRDRGRQAGDVVDVGHADLVDQAARVRRDRLEVAALRLGVQRAERERRLARPRDAREHDQRVARDVDVDVPSGCARGRRGRGRIGRGRRRRWCRPPWRARCGPSRPRAIGRPSPAQSRCQAGAWADLLPSGEVRFGRARLDFASNIDVAYPLQSGLVCVSETFFMHAACARLSEAAQTAVS